MKELKKSHSVPSNLEIDVVDTKFLENEIENILPYSTKKYDDMSFWDSKYSKDASTFEWYFQWSKLRPIVRQYVKETDLGLDVGCGTSAVAADMIYDGFKKVICLDISSVCIDVMKERYSHMNNISWVKGSCCNIKSSKKFDVVIDKGTMDSLFCNGGDPSAAKKEISEISQIMKIGGFFFLVSCGSPNIRTFLFKDLSVGMSLVDTKKIEIGEYVKNVFYVYVVQKTC